jgi:hypothetical protein
MYTVHVQWGSLTKTYRTWSLSNAKAWMYTYPKQDVFAKVTDLFGRTLAVRYYR